MNSITAVRGFLFGMLLPLFCAGSIMAQEWQFQCQRPAIAPKHWLDNQVTFRGQPTMALAGDGKNFANGCWSRTIAVEEKDSYRFQTFFRAEKVEEPARSILARIIWLDRKGKQTARPEYPRTLEEKSPGGWSQISQVYQAPAATDSAKIELVFRWDPDGTVYFGGTSLMRSDPLPERRVKVAAIHFRPRESASPRENLDKFSPYIEKAGKQGADIVCLPEGMTMVGTGLSYVEAAESVPGPSTEYLGRIARQHRMYIVAGIYEQAGDAVYNTAVLLGRDGTLVGRYRKVCLPREEIEGGITPGDRFPVFDLDFGRIGMMICWDVAFPEPARALAAKGAEMIFMPIWGGNINLAKARAIENQIYLVSSTYGMKTGVFDQEGELIVEGTEENPVAIVEVDLNRQKLWPWLGDYKNRIPREKPPQSVK